MQADDPFGAFERAGWNDGRAQPYLGGLASITAHAIEPLLDATRVGAGTRVLDVATGPGDVAGRAAERGAVVDAVDFSQEMLDLAAERFPTVRFQYADVYDLPFGSGEFDSVVVGFLMPHVSDLPRAVAECVRVTRPGGRVALATWDSLGSTRFVGAVSEAMAEVGARPPDDLPGGPSFFQYSGDTEFAGLLTGAGLTEPAVETIAFRHHVDDLDAFWSVVLGGTVRTTALVSGQPATVRQQIRTAYARILEQYRGPGGLEVPCSIKVGSARSPA